MGFQIRWFEVETRADYPHADDPQWLAYQARRAAHAIAAYIQARGAIYHRIDPKSDDYPPIVKHRWAVGFETDKDELEARKAQMIEAREDGRIQAARVVRECAERFDNPIVTGPCKHVLRQALLDAASAIERFKDNGQ
jgi:hypothetical protein